MVGRVAREGKIARRLKLLSAALAVLVGLAAVSLSATWLAEAGSSSARDRFDFSGDWRLARGPGDLTSATAFDYTSLLAESRDRMQLVRAPSRRGTLSLELTVRQGDYDHNGTSERCELAANGVVYRPGDEFWVALSIYLPPTFPLPRPGSWALIHQFYGETGGEQTGSPPIALEVTPGGEFALTVRGGAKESSGSPAPEEATHPVARVTRAQWHDFLLHVRLAKDATGLVEVWHRLAGTRFSAASSVRASGVNVLTVGGVDQDVYPETGYYRSTDPRPATLYTNGLWIRSNRQAAEAFWPRAR